MTSYVTAPVLDPYLHGLNFRNILINGDMSVAQRGTSVAVGASYNYIVDRWRAWRTAYATGMTISQQTLTAGSIPGLQYYLRCQRDSGNASTAALSVGQAIESQISKNYIGWPLTISFWARAGSNYTAASNVLNVNLATGTGNDQPLDTGFTSQTAIISQNVTLTTSWQRFTFTSAAIGNSVTQIGFAFYYQPVGTASTNDYFEVTGIQLEAGTYPTQFESLPKDIVIQRCKRYYQTSYLPGTAPGSAVSVGSGHLVQMSFGLAASGGIAGGFVSFPVSMRAQPSVTVYDCAGTSNVVTGLDGGGSSTNGSIYNAIYPTTVGHSIRLYGSTQWGLTYAYVASADL